METSEETPHHKRLKISGCHSTREQNLGVRIAYMKLIEHAFQEFADAIQTADDEVSFERIAERVTRQLGFRWFAYLSIGVQI